jgi:putative resolvase
MNEYITTKKACAILGVHPDTLRRMDKEKRISTIRTPGNKRLYNVQEYISRHSNIPNECPTQNKVSICYCRVSSRNQKDDLKRQVQYMEEKYPTHKIIKDIGSGLNFKRKGLQTILDLAYSGKLQEVVVAYKDRLCRFGFELFEYILQTQCNAKIMVLKQKVHSPEQELTQDLLHILHVFSARSYGLRKYRNQIKEDKDVCNQESTTDIVELDECV